MLRSYCSKRLSVRVSITSRKPAVVTSAVDAPLRWMRALVASVVPWMIWVTSPRSTSLPLASSATAASTPSSGRPVVSTLVETNRPSSRSSTTSVKVPPHVGADPQRHGQISSSGGKFSGGMMSTVAERCWASMPPSTRSTSPVM